MGYHSAGPTEVEDHNKYKELPTLGIIANLLMASSTPAAILPVNIPILPENTIASENLIGFNPALSKQREEIRQLLSLVRITVNQFSESVPIWRALLHCLLSSCYGFISGVFLPIRN